MLILMETFKSAFTSLEWRSNIISPFAESKLFGNKSYSQPLIILLIRQSRQNPSVWLCSAGAG